MTLRDVIHGHMNGGMVQRIRLNRQAPQRKDLTNELQERLALLEMEEAKAVAIVNRIKEQRELTARMLELERQTTAGTPDSAKRSVRRREPYEIVREELLAHDFVPKQTIVERAIAEGHEAPARAVNIILMGFLKRGFVTRTGDERYGLTEKGKEALSGETEGTLC